MAHAKTNGPWWKSTFRLTKWASRDATLILYYLRLVTNFITNPLEKLCGSMRWFCWGDQMSPPCFFSRPLPKSGYYQWARWHVSSWFFGAICLLRLRRDWLRRQFLQDRPAGRGDETLPAPGGSVGKRRGAKRWGKNKKWWCATSISWHCPPNYLFGTFFNENISILFWCSMMDDGLIENGRWRSSDISLISAGFTKNSCVPAWHPSILGPRKELGKNPEKNPGQIWVIDLNSKSWKIMTPPPHAKHVGFWVRTSKHLGPIFRVQISQSKHTRRVVRK